MESRQEPSSLFPDSDAPNPNEPTPATIDWSPLVSGGSNFRTHKLRKVGYHTYQSVPTVGYYIFNLIFVLFGAGALVGAYFGLNESWFMVLILGFMGLVFMGVGGTLLIRALNPFTVDLDTGVFYKGKSYDPYASPEDAKSGSIREIHALQLVTERVSGDKTTYNSYEMNLVLKDGRRVNVMDHGSRKKIHEDATLISDALNIPIWNDARWANGR